jgi:endonuclease/exonuclease/phosphatase family metal-dependent hydrolase
MFSAPSCPPQRHSVVLACCLLLLGIPGLGHAEALPITLDGLFGDWIGPVEMTDATGDAGGSGVDFGEFDFANDDHWLFVRFTTGVEVPLQESNNLVLYLDTDMNAGTGLAINGIGADLSWRFGDRQGTWHPTGTTVYQDDILIRQLPTVTGSLFECSIGRAVQPNGTADLFPGTSFRALLVDSGGDQVPDNGTTLTYTFDATPVPDPTPIDWSRENAGDVRVVTWNARDLEGGALWSGTASAAADRIFSALDPDIICFQEIYSATAAETAALIESFLPSGGAWDARSVNDCKLVTRYPILGFWALDGNLAVHLDTTADWGVEALVVSAHLPCCQNNTSRQAEIDHIMSFFRDAMTPGGLVDVASGTVFLITGDLNLVGDSQQLTTLRTGDIVDNSTYGPDFAPDWDGTDLADSRPLQSEARFAYTWRSDFSSYQPGRLDFVLFTDSSVDAGRHFSVYTPEMSGTTLAAYGVLDGDVTSVSDHLPVVVDLRESVPTDVGPQDTRQGGVHIEALQSEGSGVRFSLVLDETARANVEIFDVRGQRVSWVRHAADGPLSAGQHTLVWSGRTQSGALASNGIYWVRVLTRSATGATMLATQQLRLLR